MRFLQDNGVPFFCVPTLNRRSCVAVEEQHRSDLCERLDRLRRATPGAPPIVVLPSRPPRLNKLPAVVSVYAPVTNETGSWVLGAEYACDIEFWRKDQSRLIGPRRHYFSSVPTVDDIVSVPASTINSFLPRFAEPATAVQVPTHRTFSGVGAEDVTFPIDAVYTWVDGGDPDWQQRKAAALNAYPAMDLNQDATNMARYASRDELRYSLRSLVYFAPWIRNVYLVTDDQVPPWLDLAHPGITVVRHRDIFDGTGTLPTFNSHAIESRLHRIPGLAEHFIYFNDDMFLGRPILPHKFFHANGVAKFFMSFAQIDPSPPTVLDLPVTAAGKNNRRHIAEQFGRTITRKMRHVPYALRRSVLEEIESTLPSEVLTTASHQFRHPGDLSIPSSLAHYWAFLTGRAVPGSIKFLYAGLSNPRTSLVLARLAAHRNYDGFCLNDTQFCHRADAEQHAMMADFLPAYFPFRAPFELPEDVAAHRATFGSTQLMNRQDILPIAREGDRGAQVAGKLS